MGYRDQYSHRKELSPNWFDYVYYRVCLYYQERWKEDSPTIYAMSAITLSMSFNVLKVLFLYSYIQDQKLSVLGVSKYSFLLFAMTILVYNLYRYNKIHPYKKLRNIFENESIVIRKKRGRFVLIYLVSTFTITFVIAGILGAR